MGRMVTPTVTEILPPWMEQAARARAEAKRARAALEARLEDSTTGDPDRVGTPAERS